MRIFTTVVLSILSSGAFATGSVINDNLNQLTPQCQVKAELKQPVDLENQVDTNLVTIVESHKGNHNTFINPKVDAKSGLTTEFDITGE